MAVLMVVLVAFSIFLAGGVLMVVLVGFAVFLAALVAASLILRAPRIGPGPWRLAVPRPGPVAWLGLGIVLFLGLLMTDPPREVREFCLPGLVISVLAWAVLAWAREFLFLMGQADESFPGRFDKLIWAALLLLAPPVGVGLFWTYRRSHFPAAKPVESDPAHELA